MQVYLAQPRGFCAGVVRAIEIVERALEKYGPPVYVRHEIVHNKYVVESLKNKGAIFVEDLSEVPPRAVTVFSAHGVARSVEEEAASRGLPVLNATCPLVTKVHNEARRFAAQGYDILLIGHEGHEEVVGTTGEAPARIHLVDGPDAGAAVQVADPSRVAWLSQTTLSVDETIQTVAALRERFPRLMDPPSDDICYATQNRQNAVKELVEVSDVVLVVGSRQSSNANRMVEVARMRGGRAFLVDSLADVEPDMIAGARSLGLTASASSPEWLVQEIIGAFSRRGASVELMKIKEERIHFPLPRPAGD
jgi:4-hydroxy-3-methylbut-2-enyl diphosphate reductase